MISAAQMPAQLEVVGAKEALSTSTTSEVTSHSLQQKMIQSNFTWEKLSPSEFQQLQDFAACEYD